MKKRTLLLVVMALLAVLQVGAQTDLKYQLPPKDIVDMVDAKPTPTVRVSPNGEYMAFMERSGMRTIEDLSREELRIGGLRLDPATNGPSRSGYYVGLKFMNMDDQSEFQISGLPSGMRMGNFSFSPDGEMFYFTNTLSNRIELWVGNIENRRVQKIADRVNDVLGPMAVWLPDGKSLIYQAIPAGRGERALHSNMPEGPVIQETSGSMAAVRTYQDLLENPVDVEIFDYFSTSQLMMWDGNNSKPYGKPEVYTSISISPNGQYALIQYLEKPYSYLVPYYRFPTQVQIWDMNANKVHTVAEVPLEEEIPKGFGSVTPEPRSFGWRSDAGASLYWVQALDEGDAKKKVEYRDQMYYMNAPFNGTAQKSVKTKLRYGGITWGKEGFALISESWRSTRKSVQSSFNPDNPSEGLKTIFELSSEDRYNDPGRFVTTLNENGKRVLMFDSKGKKLYLRGQGASPEGNRPFLDEYILANGETNRLFRSEAPYYESVSDLLDMKKGLILVNRQSQTEPPNYYIRDLKKDKLTQITDMQNPYPQLEGVHKELVTYERNDGVKLSFDLYLPKGYNKDTDGTLPTILWAYPREYKSAAAAGQISGSPYTFTRVSSTSILLFVTQGYAILNNAAFPIIGEGDQQPNDTFIEQLVANAEAAIDKAVDMGVTDRNRVAVGGHSYGAFMTANLLAHSRLFAAGIARSGAYNRTLTPFGFQAEPRTFWEAPEIYFGMSPFMHADQVKDPLLMIHGIADNNSGTFPIQSERFYAALKGHGATARLVMLPHESHGYSARESVLHVNWETLKWLDKYVKNKK